MTDDLKNKPTKLGLDKKQFSAITKALGTIGAIADKVTQPPKQNRMRSLTCDEARAWYHFYMALASFYDSVGDIDNLVDSVDKANGILRAGCV